MHPNTEIVHAYHLCDIVFCHVSYYCIICAIRLLILDCPETFNMKPTTCHTEGRFQSSGQLQRPFTIASTPLPVMSGAMAVSSMRYGHWDTNHFMISPMPRYIAASKLKIC